MSLFATAPLATASDTSSAVQTALSKLEPDSRERLHDARAVIASMRERLAGGSFSERAAALITASHREVPDVDVIPPGPAAVRQLGDVPPELAGPIAGLVQAVQASERALLAFDRSRISAFYEKFLRWEERFKDTATRRPARFRRPTLKALERVQRWQRIGPMRLHGLPEPPRIPAYVERYMTATNEAVMRITKVLDEYLPLLATRGNQRTGTQAGSCDLLDATPAVCVGSEADNKHTKEAALVVDLGGDDVYRTNAGGAVGARPVALAIDLDGDDRYESDEGTGTTLCSAGGKDTVTQGAGHLGVGVLVDSSGDDTYIGKLAPSEIDQPHYCVTAHGSGAMGAGLLFDGEGSDRYLARGRNSNNERISIHAQGVGSIGIGGIFDEGSATDLYSVDLGHTTTTGKGDSYRGARSQAFSTLTSAGVIYDEGGDDLVTLTAQQTWLPPQVDLSDVWGQTVISPHAQAHASSGLTTALLLFGEGNNRYLVDLRSKGIASQSPWAQVFSFASFGGGIAAIDDLGGKDSYEFRSRGVYNRTITVDDDCLCGAAEAVVDLTSIFFGLNAQVWSGPGSTALIDDHGGDDRYLATSDISSHIRLRDRLKKPSFAPLLRVFSPGGGLTAMATATSGLGLIHDAAGSDRYTYRASKRMRAGAVSDNFRGKPDVRLLTFGTGATGQGSGPQGSIIDLEGKGDSFKVDSEIHATTYPDRDASFEMGYFISAQQVVALGENPKVFSDPAPTVTAESPGFHGFGTWLSCCKNGDDVEHQAVDHAGTSGHVPGATGDEMKLLLGKLPKEVIADPRAKARLPVMARLEDPKGKAQKRVPIHFHLQMHVALTNETSAVIDDSHWESIWSEESATDKKGVARARLPLFLLLPTGDDLIPDPSMKFRVLATYDGKPGWMPRHAAHELRISPPGKGGRR